jgi:DNA polymerase-3 subunit delta'
MQFKQVIGHQEAKQHLIDLVKKDNIPHAQLFLSSVGVGSLPLALAFAQYMVCENKQEDDSCGVCGECIKSQKLIHPDIHYTYPVVPKKSGKPSLSADYIVEWRKVLLNNPYIDENNWLQSIEAENKQGNITADEARAIIRNLSLKSYESRYKIQIIWLAEALGKEGNILLKLLEEPPADTILILISENADQILPTIISRCQLLKLHQLSDAEIEDALIKKGVTRAKAQQVAFLSNGSFADALHIADKEIDDITYTLIDWMKQSIHYDIASLVKWVDELSKQGREKIKTFFEYTEHVVRETMLTGYQKGYQPKLNNEEMKVAQALKKYFTNYEQIHTLIRLLDEKHYEIERNVNAKIVLLSSSIKLHRIMKGGG